MVKRISELTANKNIVPFADPVTTIASVTSAAKALRQSMDVLSGVRGIDKRAITVQDLRDLGFTEGIPLPTQSPLALYCISVFVAGAIGVTQVVSRTTFSDTVEFQANLFGSRASMGLAPGNSTYTIRVAQGVAAPNLFTTVGTLTFSSSPIGVFAMTNTLLMAPGDVMMIDCTTADGLSRDLSATISGVLRA